MNSSKILVIDDEEPIRNLCLRTLQKKEYQVTSASNGDQALKLFEKGSHPFDLVLTDLRMPGKMDGEKILNYIKENAPETDVILMTAVPTVETVISAFKNHAYDYIIKPFGPEELDWIVARCLEKRDLKINLEYSYQELKKMNDSREMFTQLLVHDLNNPLSGIIGNAQLLLMDELNPEQKETLQDIIISSQRLHQMIIDILDIGKMEWGEMKPHYQTFHITEIFDEILKLKGHSFQQKNIKISNSITPPNLTLTADRSLLLRILQNLLDNAFYYTFENGKVELSASMDENNGCSIQIKDDGQAVSEEYRQAIFTRTGRITRSGERTNRGLGLYFCKLAVEAHQGTLELETTEKGCSFLIKIPDCKLKIESNESHEK